MFSMTLGCLHFSFWDLVVSLSIILLSGFLCLLERSHEARSFAINKRGVLLDGMGPRKKRNWFLRNTADGKNEWNRDEVHPAFFDDEDISTQERISMDEGGRNSCINKGTLGRSTAWYRLVLVSVRL
jgi:hypothetical protein